MAIDAPAADRWQPSICQPGADGSVKTEKSHRKMSLIFLKNNDLCEFSMLGCDSNARMKFV
ncbi:hypothetical protein N5D48_04340 [Pseudomonas sp. GD03858]|uniref:hypothetical protein n=1 Tax=Pseudomonas sp. GD03858 TaxID=2975388 RepID=UPI00244A3859|nr:hypothetical protein [Pseudomonas sp. GD03858]MDH0661621.1 hypothetical protein [Pseudomonas sp. GD03858]